MVESISFQDTIAREKNYYFWKARVGLYALLKGCGVTQGDEVIVQAFTCVAVPNPIIYAGALPVYVDIDARTFTGQTDLVLEHINSRTKAIILQNSFGHPPDYDGVMSVAKKLGIPVISDCAHGAGSSYKGVLDGTVADASIFSFQWTKPVTAGLGGCAVVINESCFPFLEDVVKECVDPTRIESTMLSLQYFVHSRIMTPNSYWTLVSAYRLLRKMGMNTGSSSRGETSGAEIPEGFMKKMGASQCRVVKSGLSSLEGKVKKRQEAARYYDSLCDEHGLQRAFQADYAGHSFLRYPILVNNNAKSFDYAAQNKIQLGEWFRTPIDPVVNLSLWGYTKGSCPIAESVCQQIINLPTDNPLSKSQFKQILN